MSQNPKTFAKQKQKRQQENKESNQLNETQNSNDHQSADVRMLTIEEQLECFADLLIDELLKQML